MSDKIVYDFVCCFFPEHKKYWDCLTEKEAALLNNIKFKEEELEKIFFKPEENAALVEKVRDKFDELEVFYNHRECVYDYFLYQKVLRHSNHENIIGDYGFIFYESEKYEVQIKEPKSIEAYMKKILKLLPPCYQEKHNELERSWIFGTFKKKLEAYVFSVDVLGYGDVEFKRNQLKLIPAFIEYRCKNYLKWFFELEAKNQYNKALLENAKSECLISANQKAKDAAFLFEYYFMQKVKDVFCRYGFYDSPFGHPVIDFNLFSGYCRVEYDHDSAGCSFSYKIYFDDVFANLKKFELFIANTEKQSINY